MDEEVMTPDQLVSSGLLPGVTKSWLTQNRFNHRVRRGPELVPFVQISPKRVAYRRADVVAWLDSRSVKASS